MERVYAGTVALWAAYLALAPVVYLFGIEEQVDLRAMKAGLILFAAVKTFAHSLLSGRAGVPLAPFGLLGLAGLGLLMTPGVVQAPWPLPALDPLLDLTMAALVGWSFYRMRRDGWPVAGLLRGAAAAVAAMAAVYAFHSLFVATGGDLCAWDPVEMHRLFGHSNAGWAASLAAFTALLAFLGIGGTGTGGTGIGGTGVGGTGTGGPGTGRLGTVLRGRVPWWTGALLLALAAALVVSGGRAGILVAAGALLLASLWGLRRPSALALALMALALAATFWQPECAQSDRTENARSALSATPEAGINDGLFWRLNTLLTGRMVGYADAVRMIGQRPLAGWGWRQVRVGGWQDNRPEVHNLYLKVALYCGIPAAAALAGLIGWLGACWWRWQRRCDDRERPLARACGAVLLAGVGISMVEPGTLIGSFQYLSLWWAAAGVVMAGAGVPELVFRHRKVDIISAD